MKHLSFLFFALNAFAQTSSISVDSTYEKLCESRVCPQVQERFYYEQQKEKQISLSVVLTNLRGNGVAASNFSPVQTWIYGNIGLDIKSTEVRMLGFVGESAFNILSSGGKSLLSAPMREYAAAAERQWNYVQQKADVDVRNYEQKLSYEALSHGLNSSLQKEQIHQYLSTQLKAPTLEQLDSIRRLNQSLSIMKDGFSYKQVKYDSESHLKTLKLFDEALKATDDRQISELFENLKYQTDPIQRQNADKILQPYTLPNGLIDYSKIHGGANGPLSSHTFLTPIMSKEGQVVRRVANQFESYWSQSNGLSGLDDSQNFHFVLGLAFINAADQALHLGKTLQGISLLKMAKGSLLFTKGLVQGGITFVTEGVEALGLLAKLPGAISDYAKSVMNDPNELINGPLKVLSHIPAFVDALVVDYATKFNQALNDPDPERRGEAVGNLLIDGLLNFATSGMSAASLKGTATYAKTAALLEKALARIPKSAVISIGNVAVTQLVEHSKLWSEGFREEFNSLKSVSKEKAFEYLQRARLSLPVSLESKFKVLATRGSAEINLTAGMSGRLPPYLPRSPVQELITKSPIEQGTLVRFFKDGVSKPFGEWLVEYESVKGLTPLQIKDRLGLQFVPDSVSFPELPGNLRMRRGLINENFEGTGSKLIFQYEIAIGERVNPDWFQTIKRIGEKL